jgi:hypothetical protein
MTFYIVRVEDQRPIPAPECFEPSELVLLVKPEYRSVVLTELDQVAELAEAA